MWLSWLTFLSSVFLAKSLSAKDIDAAFSKCWAQKPRNLRNTDFIWYSSSVLGELTNCIEKSIFDSENLCDQMSITNINEKKLNNALRHFCSKFDIQSCRVDLFQKHSHHKKHFDTNLKSYAYCIYDKYATCNTTMAKIIKDNLDGVKDNATHVFLAGSLCDKEIDDVLFKCWTQIPEPFEQIKKYGKGFYDKVTKCVERSIYESEHLYDQLNFELCSKFDVMSCQEDYYTKDYGIPKSVDDLLRIYGYCIYNKYTTCDTTLDKIIKYNLLGIKTYNMVASKSYVGGQSYSLVSSKGNSAHLSDYFILIVSHVAIILSLFF